MPPSAPVTPLLSMELNDCHGTTDDNNREWWLWHFAGRALTGILAANIERLPHGITAADCAIDHALQLRAKLENMR